jgi:heme-degrading monooxygenase HmoA
MRGCYHARGAERNRRASIVVQRLSRRFWGATIGPIERRREAIVMMISITTGRATGAQAEQVEVFLRGFLPRVRRFPGVTAIYHFTRGEGGEQVTAILWENEQALRAYRESELMKEVTAFMQKHGLTLTREAHPVSLAL